MELRTYQQAAVAAVYNHLRSRDDHPCVVIPTGGGKTPVLATICRDAVQRWDGRVVILAHVKELLEQAVEKIAAIAPDLSPGVYSAGLRRRELDRPVTVAGIQSIYKKACEVSADRPIDLVIVDEAHRIPARDDGMYRQFIADMRVINPNVRIIGLTATPFRLGSGEICGPENILNAICYEIGVRPLIDQGFLSPLRTKAGATRTDLSGLHVRGGEFVAGEVQDLMDDNALVESACREIVEQTQHRCATLLFASGIKHGRHLVRVLADRHGIECGFVCNNTPAKERAEILGRFRAGDLHYLANVNVLTTGFDVPHIDCVALLRPTMSPGLYYQMVGRGFRLAPGKSDSLVLDFGGNVVRHGPVDAVRVAKRAPRDGEAPAKECPQCHEVISAGHQKCPQCGHEFPPPDHRKHDARATSEGILSGQLSRKNHDIEEVTYHVHFKRNDPAAPQTLRVEYHVGIGRPIREWVCFDHDGYARRKAEQWWRTRSVEPVPECVEDAVELASAGALAETLAVTTARKAGEKYDRVISHQLGPRPPRLDDPDAVPAGALDYSDDGIPF